MRIAAQATGGGVWVALSPDGTRVMTGNQDIAAVQVWDVGPAGGAEWAVLPAPAGPAGAIAFTHGRRERRGRRRRRLGGALGRSNGTAHGHPAPHRTAAAPALVTALAAGAAAR